MRFSVLTQLYGEMSLLGESDFHVELLECIDLEVVARTIDTMQLLPGFLDA